MTFDDVRAALRAAYNDAPVEDDDRRETEEECGRHVIVELPAAFPRKSEVDVSVRLPVRVAWHGGSGIVLEVGPYDFDDEDVQMLKQAVAFFEHCGGETRPVEMIPRGAPNPNVIWGPVCGDASLSNVVEVDFFRAHEVSEG